VETRGIAGYFGSDVRPARQKSNSESPRYKQGAVTTASRCYSAVNEILPFGIGSHQLKMTLLTHSVASLVLQLPQAREMSLWPRLRHECYIA
jgi:hypothetical protein